MKMTKEFIEMKKLFKNSIEFRGIIDYNILVPERGKPVCRENLSMR